MKNLVSSVACLLGGGAESIYVWRACQALAKDYQLQVLSGASCHVIARVDWHGGLPEVMQARQPV